MNNRMRYIRESVITYAFYQLPKFLFDDEFAELSNDARVLYSLLRNRLEVSIKNRWYDKSGEVYLHFKREDMQYMLQLSKKTITKAVKDLKSFSLMEEIKLGLGKPNKIFLLSVSHPPGSENKQQATSRVRYTRQSVVNNVFYQLPRFLFSDEFAELSNDAKVLYSILRNRHELSLKNGWYDENEDVYLYFKREDMQNMLRLSIKPIIKAMNSLKAFGLLEEVKQGLGKPNKIYLLSVNQVFGIETPDFFMSADEETTGNVQRCNNDTSTSVKSTPMEMADLHHRPVNSTPTDMNILPLRSGDFTPTDMEILHPHSYNKEIYNEFITESVQSNPVSHDLKADGQDIDETEDIVRKLNAYIELVKDNISYNDLALSRRFDIELVDEFIEIIIDTIMTEGGTIRINGEDKPRALIKSAFLKLKHEHIEHAIDQFKSVQERITKKRQYILTLLYNCRLETDSHYTNLVQSDKWQ